jgi:hypothetical protein
LTEKDVINILKSANNFNSVGNLILSNVDLNKPQVSLKIVEDKHNGKPRAGKEIELEVNPTSNQIIGK